MVDIRDAVTLSSEHLSSFIVPQCPMFYMLVLTLVTVASKCKELLP